MNLGKSFAQVAAGLAVAAAGQAVQAAWVAGLQPDQRPAEAPTLLAQPASAPLVAWRLRGISRPWPGNVKAIATEQGRWFSPLFRRGMNGRYDWRGLQGMPAQPPREVEAHGF